MSAEENKAIARRLTEEVVNKKNLDAIDEIVAADYVDHNPAPGQAPDREGLKQFFTMLYSAFPDWHSTIYNMIAEGGSKVLYNANVEGVKLKAMYGAFSEHVIYYIVEADSLKAIHQFLDPGWKRCTCTVTPVAEAPIVR